MTPSYIHHPEEIQELKDNVLYRFAALIKRVGINRSTLQLNRDNLQLPCTGPTTVLGWRFKEWANATPEKRKKLTKEKFYGRYWPAKKGVKRDGT